MAAKNHPTIKVLENIKIWRYMDFTKFVSLLEDKSIFLVKASSFEDRYEGSNSKATQAWLSSVEIPEETMEKSSAFSRWRCDWTYINCWHMNDHESAAMWKLYAKTAEAVAVQSTYERLHECLPDDVYLGPVEYMDYEKEEIPVDYAFLPFFHKRKSFEHERELRAVKSVYPRIPGKGFDYKADPVPGLKIPVDINVLIENIYIAPTAPAWFREIVYKTIKRHDLNFNVRQSNLDDSPIF